MGKESNTGEGTVASGSSLCGVGGQVDSQVGAQPLLATEQVLILLVAELAQSVSHATIRTYLSGVQNLHLTRGWSDLPMRTLRLDLVLKGTSPEGEIALDSTNSEDDPWGIITARD